MCKADLNHGVGLLLLISIVKHIILVRLQTQNSMKDFDEGIAVAYAGVDSGHFVCLTMVKV